MRRARIKVSAEAEEGVYHLMSRTVNGEWLFGTVAKGRLKGTDVKNNCHLGQKKFTSRFMRRARIKVSAEAEEGVYHLMSRTVNGECLFGTVAKEILRRQLWQVGGGAG